MEWGMQEREGEKGQGGQSNLYPDEKGRSLVFALFAAQRCALSLSAHCRSSVAGPSRYLVS